MTPKTDDDKYSALWLSHSSMSDFLKCPRLYYLVNVYKNPLSGRKITIMNPHLALGQVVHGILEDLALLPAEERFRAPLVHKLDAAWTAVTGKKGGFLDDEKETVFKQKAREMLQRIQDNPGPLLNKAVRLKQELPFYWLSEELSMILCGKVDWIEYLQETDSIHVLDFKTGGKRERESSLQLPIYLLLLRNTQNRPVSKMSYWYLQLDDSPEEVSLPQTEQAHEEIMKIAKRIKLARQLNHFSCSLDEKTGCKHCAPYEAVVKGRGEFVGVGEYNKEMYILTDASVALS